MNDKRKFRAFLSKSLRFVDNNKFNIYDLNTETNKTIDIIIGIIERRGNFEMGYRFIAAAAIIGIYIKIGIGVRIKIQI